MVNYPLWTREQAYEILNRTTINALGTYGFREKFLQEINSLVSKYSKNGHQKNGKNILERLDDLVFIVYTQKVETIQRFNYDICLLKNMLERAVTDSSMIYKINNPLEKDYPPENVEKRKHKKNNAKKNNSRNNKEEIDILKIYFEELKKIHCPTDLPQKLSKEEKKKLIKSVEEGRNKKLRSIEDAKIYFYKIISENEMFYSIFKKQLKEGVAILSSPRGKYTSVLRNYDNIEHDKQENRIRRITSLEQKVFEAYGMIHAIRNNSETKTSMDSICYNLSENIKNILSPELFYKIVSIVLIRYNNLRKLKNIENDYMNKRKEIPQKLISMIENKRKRIEPTKTVGYLLSEGLELSHCRDKIINEKNEMTRSLLRSNVARAKHSYLKYNLYDFGISMEDLIQEANLSLAETWEKVHHDEKNLKSLKSFNLTCIDRALSSFVSEFTNIITTNPEIRTSLIKYNRIKKKVKGLTDDESAKIMNVPLKKIKRLKILSLRQTSLDSLTYDSDTELVNILPDPEAINPLEEIIKSEESEKIREAISELKGEYAKILMLRYYSDSGDPMTLQEIGDIFGVTRERIRQKEEKALKQLGKKLEILEITV